MIEIDLKPESVALPGWRLAHLAADADSAATSSFQRFTLLSLHTCPIILIVTSTLGYSSGDTVPCPFRAAGRASAEV